MSHRFFEDESMIYVLPSVALDIGLKNAVVLSYVEDNEPAGTVRMERDLSFMSRTTIQRCLAELEELGLLKDVSFSDPYEIRDKVISMEEADKKTCEWCGLKSITLHEHHFPIPRRQGGEETVRICPNCHYGYHHLETKRVTTAKKR